MIALATMCAVSVLFRTVGQPFEVFESAAARFRETNAAARTNSATGASFDATISECLQQIILTGKDQVKAGLPLFDVPPIDPVNIGSIFITDNIDLVFNLQNVTISGLTEGMNAKNLRVEYNTADKRIYLVLKAPELGFTTPYKMQVRVDRLMPSFFEPGYGLKSEGLANATLTGVSLKAFVEFKREPTWGQRLEIDSTYLDFTFDNSVWQFHSKSKKDVLVKYVRLIANEKEALDPIVEVLRPTIVRGLNKFLYDTMRNVFKNVILI